MLQPGGVAWFDFPWECVAVTLDLGDAGAWPWPRSPTVSNHMSFSMYF